MSFFSHHDANIFYDVQGSGQKTITLINGHNRTHKDFRPMAKFLVQHGFRVISLDNRGSGQSEFSGAFGLLDLAKDVTGLWQHLDIRESHLLGISMGGVIAQTIALSGSAVPQSLFLVSTAARASWLSGETRWAENLPDVTTKLKRYFNRDFAERNKLLVESMAKQILADVVAGNLTKNSEEQRRAIGDFDYRSDLKRISVPVQILHGRDDEIISYEAAEELVSSIPQAQLTPLEKIGHLILAESPKVLYQWVLDGT
jgi:pimeloyl-ACP methyl ester carboxylesterase